MCSLLRLRLAAGSSGGFPVAYTHACQVPSGGRCGWAVICCCQASGGPCSKADCVPTAIKETREALLNVNKTLGELKNSTARLSTSLQDVKGNLEQSLKDPVCSQQPERATCNDIRMTLSQLDDNTNLGQVSRVTVPQGCVFRLLGSVQRGRTWQVHSGLGLRWPSGSADCHRAPAAGGGGHKGPLLVSCPRLTQRNTNMSSTLKKEKGSNAFL